MTVGVIGGGAWGTALAQVAAGADDVLLWARESEVVAAINSNHENAVFLPGVSLAPAIRATSDLAELAKCSMLLVVTPAQHMRAVLADLPAGRSALVLCAKGIEAGTRLLMSEVAADVWPDAPVAVLSGPTFAHEVAAALPTAVTSYVSTNFAGSTIKLAGKSSTGQFKVYVQTSTGQLLELFFAADGTFVQAHRRKR